jgi:putative restriction endonuclease
MVERVGTSSAGAKWSRDELILTFDLYCRIPFSKTKANNPAVIDLARILFRSPASVARKLGNFGAFDPELKKKGISGLTHASKQDKVIWDEFNSDWGRLVVEAATIREQKTGKPNIMGDDIGIPVVSGPTEREGVARQRIHQDFFRASVLAAYNEQCCVCRIPHRELLIASHIIPWNIRDDTRVNPENGLCLCATHDRAFDHGLMAIGTGFTLILCDRLRKSPDPASTTVFRSYDGKHILLPDRFLPRREFLRWHLENIFSR